MRRVPSTPAGIMTAAVLLFTYGGLLLTCGVCGTIGGAAGLAMKGNQPANEKRLQEIIDKEAPGNQIVGFANTAMHFVMGAAMIGAGIGVLMWSQIARFAAYALIVLELMLSCGVKVYQMAVVMPATQKMMDELMKEQQKMGAPPMPFDLGALMTGTGAIVSVVILLAQLGLLIPVVICLSTAGARAAFSGKLQAATDQRADDERDRRSGDDDYDDGFNAPKPPKNPGDTGIQSSELQ